jgi:hypothetical protein
MTTIMLQREELEARGIAALARLIPIAHRDHGGAVRIRRFLIGLYNGSTFPFDLTDFRVLDRQNQEDCMAVLAMDIHGPSVEIHHRIPGTSEVIADWAADAWPLATPEELEELLRETAGAEWPWSNDLCQRVDRALGRAGSDDQERDVAEYLIGTGALPAAAIDLFGDELERNLDDDADDGR